MTASILDAFLDESNLLNAFRRVRQKGSRGGIDNVSVDAFEKDLKKNLRRLRQDIIEGGYTPEPVAEIRTPKFNEKKEWRHLGLPTVADKIIQKALLTVVEPLAEKLFLDTSYAYRKDKGHYRAIRRVEHNLNAGKRQWVVRQDVDDFFDRLNHDHLISLFSDLVGHEKTLVTLVALWCRSGIIAKGGKWKDVEAGVRQGQVISPLLANLYLHELDVFVKENQWGWVRYADDYILQCASKDQALEADLAVKDYLSRKLSLQLNENKSPVASLEQGFDFLGIHFKGTTRSISEKKRNRINSKLGFLLSPKSSLSLDEVFVRLGQAVKGWQFHYGFLGSGEQFQFIEQKIITLLGWLVQCRIKQGKWPRKPPPHLRLPLPASQFLLSEKEKKKQLLAIWEEGQAALKSEKPIQQADQKAGVKRRQFKRKQAAGGELFILSPGHFVGIQSNRIVVRQKQKIVSEIPVSELKGITVAEQGLSVSTNVLHHCAVKDIPFHIIDGFGNITAVLQHPAGARAEIVQKQVALRDDKQGLHLARMFILGKTKNQLALLKSYGKYKKRNNGYKEAFEKEKEQLEQLTNKINSLNTDKEPGRFRNGLMGLEGNFASKYWHLISYVLPGNFEFAGRKRKGAGDPVNSLLNYGYGILYSQALYAVVKAGLNPTAGFLHSYQPGKPVLIYDLIEEFRAPVVDRTVISMLNRGGKIEQQKDGFLTKACCKKLAGATMTRLGTEVVHKGRKDTLQNILFQQAVTLREYLHGKKKYKPYLSRW
ncbi:CRISPR-associated endonuclease Cas1 [Desulfobacter hydrogenophilus]|uniref:CRISPR-associated endonuclease Cas1 n=1 Tax=Desulfobacter hydrogenophilus TaxID=2291 RepID=A0A328F8B3_9BACT|nr:CRISPR-associated endonuclease Cas1 [Desulfobacter hydrogenophilus]NDY73829.1 CRISPR-associated endonuclease Cas1 [Desulfobacter hydrogenophilus]QBH13160.1 CRISPR-associated endonuclease Cas1 [Desulfobacter hydrogenophilus]RAM00446.1 CRISPR-associated endonuclease Cas1 [Desulfobacter hydrogenophilus]